MAAALERARHLPRRRRPRASQVLRPRHVPLPLGGRAPRRPSAGLHRLGHLFALQAAQGIQRAAPHGLRRIRPARRAVRHPDRAAPRRHDRAQHRPLPRAARQNRFFVRLGPRGAHLRPGLLQVDAVGVPRNVQPLLLQRHTAGTAHRRARRSLLQIRQRGAQRRLHRRDALHGRRVERQERSRERAGFAELPARLPRRHDGQLVSAAGHRARQRRGARRAFGPRRLPRRAEAHEAVAAPRHGLRPAYARRSRQARLERFAQGNPAQLDRPFGRRAGLLRHRGFGPQARNLHHAPRHHLRRHVHGHRSRARVGRRAHHAREPRRRRGVHRPGQEAVRARAHRRNTTRQRRGDRFFRRQSVHRQGHSHLYFRLRARRLRHGGHHGRPGPRFARLRFRPPLRARHRAGGRGRRPRKGILRRQGGPDDQLRFPQRQGCQGGHSSDVRRGRAPRPGQAAGQLPPARRHLLAPALLGRAVSRLLQGRCGLSPRRRQAPVGAAPHRELRSHSRGRTAAGARQGLVHLRGLPLRALHHARIRRVVGLLPALHGPAQRQRARGPTIIGVRSTSTSAASSTPRAT